VPVTFNSAALTVGTGSVSSTSGSGTNTITVNLTGVANAQTITVALFGVNDGANMTDVGVRMDVLLGDTTGDRAVNGLDIGQTKGQSGQSVTASNFRTDLNVSGVVNALDIGIAKQQSGTALP
jgi:hypothetical protein